MFFQNEQNIIEFKNVTLQYGERSIFRNISFSIKEGSFHFLTGESGAGKSSLLKLIYQGNENYSGDIKIFNQNLKTITKVERPKFRQKIGVVFQSFNLIDHLSALDNVSLPLRIMGFSPDDCISRATKILDWVGLGDYLHALPETLSGGQQQRVVIARAVIANPRILLADEPTGNVDDKIAVKLLELFEGLNQMGTTVIIATHNKDLVQEFPHPELHLSNQSLDYFDPYQTTVSESFIEQRAKKQQKADNTVAGMRLRA